MYLPPRFRINGCTPRLRATREYALTSCESAKSARVVCKKSRERNSNALAMMAVQSYNGVVTSPLGMNPASPLTEQKLHYEAPASP